MKLGSLLKDKSILLLAGPGGVGKTSVSAAIALKEALLGRKVLVVTIDPARRLADSMGIQNLGNIPAEVDISPFRKKNTPDTGSLYAMMLHAKTAADSMVEHIAPSKEARDRLLKNRIYKTLSGSLAGSQEYIAMGQLHELITQGDYDFIVVDTAPTKYALDFFETPTKLIDLLDANVMGRLLKPARIIGKFGFSTFKKGSVYVLALIEKIIGLGVITEVSSFLLAAEGSFSGLKKRAEEMHTILKDESKTAFAVVTNADASTVTEASDLAMRIKDLGFPLNFMVVNRVHPPFQLTGTAEAKLQSFLRNPKMEAQRKGTLKSLGVQDEALFFRQLLGILQNARARATSDRFRLRALALRFGGLFPIVRVPFFKDEICDMKGLNRMTNTLYK